MADDNLSNSTFTVLMTRFIEELSSKLNQNKTSNNEEILSQIRSILSEIKLSQNSNQSQSSNNTSKPDDNVRGMSDAVRNAINQATQSGSNLLENQKQFKKILEEFAIDEKQKETELSTNLKSSFDDVKRELSNLHSKVEKQLSTGKLELGPFSGVVDTMKKSEDYYRNAVSMGQDYGGSIVNMRNVMSQSGMTLEQFNKALVTGSQGLRMMGVSTFSAFSGAVNASVKALGDLGMSGDQLSESMSVYSDGLRASGRLGTLSTQQMMNGFRDFATSATQMAHDLGISREEAMGRLNQAKAAPDVNILLRGIGEKQRDSINQLMGSVSNNPVLKSLLQSELFTAKTGATATSDVSKTLSASGPAAYESYREQSGLIRSILSSTSETERRSLISEWNKSLSRMGNNIGQQQAVQNLYGNQYGQQAVGLYGAIQEYNPNQVAENMKTSPKDAAEIGGKNDPLTSSVLATNHTMQEFVNHYDMFKNQIISSNKDLIAKTIDAYNSMQQFLTKRIDDLSSMVKAVGPATNSLSYVAGTAANHPLATLGVIGAASMFGHGVIGRLSSSILSMGKNFVGLNKLRAGRVTEGAGASTSYKILSGIADKLKSLTPTSLRQSITNIPSKIPRSLSSAANTVKNIPGIGMAGKALGVVGAASMAYGLYSDAGTILNKNTEKDPDKKRNADREKYRAWSDSISTVVGGGIGAGVGLLSGGTLSVPAAMMGAGVSSTLSNALDVGGHIYDWTHPSLTHKPQQMGQDKKDNKDNQDSKNQDNKDNQQYENQQTPDKKQDNKDSTPSEIKLIADKLDYSNILLKQMITKLDDMSRTIKNSSPTAN